ncbi:rod shape-determining protein MreC [Chlorobium ferrooxidans]|uniref:rod shape-determining protein MreC n=1 Tax=Chlorobium ferrooxidans TaxID=84205 RepID=UPI0002FD068E|nr:rod shape-determining protein MreC [Chlorobium ferrooxidans]
MRKFFNVFSRHNTWLLFALYCAISIFFIKLQNDDTITRVRTGGIEFSAFITDKLLSYSYLLNLKQENDRLMQVNTDLLAKVINLDAAVTDERNSRKITADSTLNASSFIMARVVSRRFSDRENMLLIDAGWKKGIRKDMTVLTPQGLVGRVTTVSENYARVMPVIHTDFKVCVVSDKSGSIGVLSWSGGREFVAQMEHVPISSSLKVNEEIVTSDFSTFSARGIPVGRVVRITPDKLFYTVDVRLAVDFSSLNQVLVAPLKIEPEKAVMTSDNTTEEPIP